MKDKRPQVVEKRRKMLQLIKSFLENDDTNLVKEITGKLGKMNISRPVSPNSASLTIKEQELIHKKIMAHNELNFYQKLYIFDKMALHSIGSLDVKPSFDKYIQRNIEINTILKKNLLRRSAQLTDRNRFMVNRKFFNYKRRAEHRLFNSKNIHFHGAENVSTGTKRQRTRTDSEKNQDAQEVPIVKPLPVKSVAQIQHIAFGTGEYAHLVIVCTEQRLLVWNLLTLRLQTAIKLSVRKLVVDPYTSLVAAFTVHDERKSKLSLKINPFGL